MNKDEVRVLVENIYKLLEDANLPELYKEKAFEVVLSYFLATA